MKKAIVCGISKININKKSKTKDLIWKNMTVRIT